MVKKKIFEHIKKMKKAELIELLETAFDETDRKEREYIFGEINEAIESKSETPKKLYKKIEKFFTDSLDEKYYAPFNMNSKNFMDVPDETDEWFTKLSKFLDKTSNLVQQKEYEIANECFIKLYELIEMMMSGENIVYADELGSWMISADVDYNKAYITSLSKTENPITFTERVIPILQNDTYNSFSGKIYSKIKRIANKAQFKEVEKEIELKKIRIK